MSNSVAAQPEEHTAAEPSPDPRADTTDRWPGRYGLVAGVGILTVAALAAFATVGAVQGLVTDGDAAATARDIGASMGRFRLGVASLYVVVTLDVVVAWALFRVYQPVHEGLSRLAAWFRIVYASVFLVALAQLAGVPDLLSAKGSAVFTPAQVDAMALAKVETFTDMWSAGLLLFGLHLLVVGCLSLRSASVPRVLGVLLALAGLGYAFDTFAAVLSEGSHFKVSSVTFAGELLLAIWLVLRGRGGRPDRPPPPAPALGRGPGSEGCLGSCELS